jgi:anti-sigma B factor antagonist
MNINTVKNGNELTVTVEGRLDTMTAPELEKALNESLDGVEKLVLDMKALDYISSAGLRVLLSTHKRMAAQGEMVIRGANEIITEIFDITGFSEILNVEK